MILARLKVIERIKQDWLEQTGETPSTQTLRDQCSGQFECAVLVLDDDATTELTCPFCGTVWRWDGVVGAHGWTRA